MTSTRLSETDAAMDWIAQFKAVDQRFAAALLDEMRLVTHAEFWEGLRALVLSRAEAIDGPVGLYTEREVAWNSKLFDESESMPRRASGPGPRPVSPLRTKGPEVGSEGVIANFVTELCRERPEKFRSHPGPDEIREVRLRAFFLVTDFIGSGGHAREYLEAAWKVSSVKSWRSFRWLRFEVLAYADVYAGRRRVESHRSKPTVSTVMPCPTIVDAFGDKAKEICRLCWSYDPVKRDREESLGYGGAGALIAFAHGCPNNAPRILHRSRKGRWRPLFPGRVTARTRSIFGDRRDATTLAKRLERLGETRLASGDWLARAGSDGRNLVAVLVAVRRGPRLDDTIARRTGLTVPEVRVYVERAVALAWVDGQRRMTDAGMRVLIGLRSYQEPSTLPLPSEPDEPYYPTSLRAP